MGAAFTALIRIVASLLAGYAIGDLVDHFIPETGEPSPDIGEYNFMERIVRSVRFWAVIVTGSVIAFFLLKNQLKKRRK
jgi:hypothetical protein